MTSDSLHSIYAGSDACADIQGTIWGYEEEMVDAAVDETERRLFRLRTLEGLPVEVAHGAGWREALGKFASEGLVVADGAAYRLTERGTEVCDSILAELA